MKTLKHVLIAVALLYTTPVMAWQITSYDTRLDIQKDGGVIVAETITADFTNDPHHGIYRDIPLSGKDRYGNNYRIRETTLSVTDNTGAAQTYKQTASGGKIDIRIGDADILLDRPKTYVIKYKLWRAVHFFDDYDEVYLNVVGPEWEVPVNNATCVVTIPNGAKANSIRTASYTGAFGSTSSDGFSDVADSRTARFWMKRAINPGESMTIVVGWPKGLVIQPSFSQEAKWFVSDNGYFFLPPIFLLGLWLLWLKEGRDPDTGKSEMTVYDPPESMSPAEIGTLIDERVDMRDITASIIDLAVRGYIKIESEKVKSFISTKTDYTLRLTKPNDEIKKDQNLSDFDKLLINALFNGMDFCIVSSLAQKFYAHIPLLQDMLYDSMVERGYFNSRPDRVRKSYLGIGAPIAVFGFFGGFILSSGDMPLHISVGWVFAIAVCGVMLAISSWVMPKKTAKGKDALLGVKGFEEYLSRAERAEIEYQERQGYFEKFLPYAIALDIAERWAQAFDGLQTKPPEWYEGYDGTFHPTIFAHDLNVATYSWGSNMASQPRSNGSGGSSFFGGGSGFSGGFSGGGCGGGGGGGW
ncbi:MAG: DUF2207 domain-containing protein [Armatimonadota bacterium]